MLKRDDIWHHPALKDEVVVCAPEERSKGLLGLVNSASLVVDSVADIPAGAGGVILLDSRPHALNELVRESIQHGFPSADARLLLVFSTEDLSIFASLAEGAAAKELTITSFGVEDRSVTVEVAPSLPQDESAEDMIRMLKLGMLTASPIARTGPDSDEIPLLRARLASALELLGEYASQAPSAEAPTETAPVSAPELAELQGRITTLNVKLAALQRKYDALAGSRLGRITLANWERKKAH
ncbi:hypothetical protein ACTQ49_03490 [Luteococcus sp. Sow4_B9]|uniref:hypothetical protein n=1 Tax=Luteococcus sp. Sow4_B9 TaxID=3438792 RepID=UPI003F967660